MDQRVPLGTVRYDARSRIKKREMSGLRPNNVFVQLGLPIQSPDIHTSGVGEYTSCRRKWLLSEVFGLNRRGFKTQAALNKGTFYHAAMYELTATNGDFNRAARLLDELLAKQVSDLTPEANDLGIMPSGRSLTSVLAEITDEKNKALASASFAWSNKPWPDPPGLLSDWNIIGLEQTIRLYVPPLRRHMRATIDMLVQHRQTNEIWIVDHKTTSKDASEAITLYELDLQPYLYTVLVAAIYGPDVKGFCHNLIQLPTIRLKRNQTIEDYEAEVAEWHMGVGRHADKNSERILRSTYQRRWSVYPHRFTREHWATLVEYRRALASCPDLWRFNRNKTYCYSYNSPCRFMPLCTVPENKMADLIQSDYEARIHRSADDENVLCGTLPESAYTQLVE